MMINTNVKKAYYKDKENRKTNSSDQEKSEEKTALHLDRFCMDEGIIDAAGQAVEKIGKTPNTLFVGIMLGVLVFVAFLVYNSNNNQNLARDAYLSAMEKRDDKFGDITDKLTDALKENTAVMIEIKEKIR